MADTVTDYVKRYGDYTFMEKPLNAVDSLALCQLSYLKFENLVPPPEKGKKPVSLRKIAADKAADGLFADKRFEKENRELFSALRKSRRFGKLKMNYYVNYIETEKETQFSAITFFLEDGTVFIAFRGTDETLIGWKEDFNMAVWWPLFGQLCAVEYLERVAENFSGAFQMGGHSKGGNFAVYAAMRCKPEVRERIGKIYSMDGPGFPAEAVKPEEYAEIEDRVVKILPHSSVVGMLFENKGPIRVVESKGFGLLQHDPYTWLIDGDDFRYVKDIYAARRFQDKALNIWIRSLEEEDRKLFVNTLYRVAAASEAKDLIELTADWKKSAAGMLGELKEMDAETRRRLRKLMKGFFDTAAEQMKGSRSVRKRGKKTQ